MERRGFLKMLGGVAMGSAVRQWPFRVYSFPSDIRIEPVTYSSLFSEYQRQALNQYEDYYNYVPKCFNISIPLTDFLREGNERLFQRIEETKSK